MEIPVPHLFEDELGVGVGVAGWRAGGNVMSKTGSQKMFPVRLAVKAATPYLQEHRRQGKPHTRSTRANLGPGWLEARGKQALGEAFSVMDVQGAGPEGSDNSLQCDLGGARSVSE